MNLVIVLHFFHLFKSVRIWQAYRNLLSAQDYALGLYFMNREHPVDAKRLCCFQRFPTACPCCTGSAITIGLRSFLFWPVIGP